MTEGERLERIDRSLVSLDRSMVGLERSATNLERLANEQGAFNERLLERFDRGAFAGIRELSRMNDRLEDQGEELKRQGEELERRAGERRAESKMEREALVRILERLDDIDRPSGSG